MPRGEVHGHSGEAETAQMLHLAPGLVRTERFAPGTTALSELDGLGRLAAGRATRPCSSATTGSAPTASWRPVPASAGDGAAIVDTIVDRVTGFVEEWLKA